METIIIVASNSLSLVRMKRHEVPLKGSEQGLGHKTLCDPVDHSPPGCSAHGIPQTRVLEWAAISFSRGPSQPGDGPQVSSMAGGFLTTTPVGRPWATGAGRAAEKMAADLPVPTRDDTGHPRHRSTSTQRARSQQRVKARPHQPRSL